MARKEFHSSFGTQQQHCRPDTNFTSRNNCTVSICKKRQITFQKHSQASCHWGI